jgi:predicted acylesterase/phospholipase RssA
MLRRKQKTALVLAGGGIMGAAYEIGCLTALDQLFEDDFDVNRFDMYIGVSAGSVIASLVANGVTPANLFRSISHDEQTVFNWRRRDIYRLDMRTMLGCFWKVFANSWNIFRSYRNNRSNFSLQDLIFIIQEQFPSGLFSLDPMQEYLCQAFRQAGLCDDFRELKSPLFIPSYDLDNGQRVIFGSEGLSNIKICQAITASCAIPFFFRPYLIGGRYYIDGNIGKVSHIDIAIEQGAKLIFLINPRVPMINDPARICLPSLSYGHCASISQLGIGVTWEQSQRIESKEKLEMAMQTYRRSHPSVDIVVIEPGAEESLLFFQSPMSQQARTQTMSYGYHLTLGQLNSRRDELAGILAKHKIPMVRDALTDAFPDLQGRGPTPTAAKED